MKFSRFMFCFAATLLMTTVAVAQTDTAFTFQGELNENGVPANAVFNMAFSLFDSASGGTLIGTPDVHGAVPVVDGKFTAQLDFGSAAFEDNRWLEIEINGVPLAPRAPVTRRLTRFRHGESSSMIITTLALARPSPTTNSRSTRTTAPSLDTQSRHPAIPLASSGAQSPSTPAWES